MGQLSAKLRSLEGNKIAFWCPGCDRAHAVAAGINGWMWNLDAERPTFSPSILIRIEWSKQPLEPGDDPADYKDEVCHSFVREGKIQFLGDCTHALSGQTVELPDWPAAEREISDG